MRQVCSVVRDLLPLYLENMVSEETGDFVREHLEHCPECAGALAAMQAGPNLEQRGAPPRSELDGAVEQSMKALRKKLRRRVYRGAAGVAAAVLALCVLLHVFPVYRIAELGLSYYSPAQIALALFVGTPADRSQAQAVLRLADQAFSDTRHTGAENEAAYGPLARYATSTDCYGDAAFNTHSLELWSAHLGQEEGWIWVYYSSETVNHDGSIARGSWRVPSLWRVEKNDAGEWAVVQILEHA